MSTPTDTSTGAPPPPAASTTAETAPPFLPAPFNATSPAPTLITQGAEALLYKTHFLDASTPAALKARPSKPYRHPTLDARLTKQRVLAEARVLVKLSALAPEGAVRVPAVLALEWDVSRTTTGGSAGAGAWLLMEWVEGRSVKELLRAWDAWSRRHPDDVEAENDLKALLRRVGRAVGAMHARGGVVHGDLTSSNLMVRPNNPAAAATTEADASGRPDLSGEIVLIDFGLASQSVQEEDRAVDLYVLERAFGSTHPRQEQWFDAQVLQCDEGYRGSFKGAAVVLKRLEDVRLRGRKRSMVG